MMKQMLLNVDLMEETVVVHVSLITFVKIVHALMTHLTMELKILYLVMVFVMMKLILELSLFGDYFYQISTEY